MPTHASRVSALDDVGNPDAPLGSEPWARWTVGQAKLRRQDLQRDVTGLQVILKKLREHAGWRPLGYPSLETLCSTELDLDGEEVNLVCGAAAGVSLGAVLAADAGVTPLADGPGNPTGANQHTVRNGANSTIPHGSTSARYLVRRLKRDHPDIAQALADGKFKSARAAGVAAGIVTVPTPLEEVQRRFDRLSAADRQEFRAWLGQRPTRGRDRPTEANGNRFIRYGHEALNAVQHLPHTGDRKTYLRAFGRAVAALGKVVSGNSRHRRVFQLVTDWIDHNSK
jgi:hypothetical protein